MQAERWHRIKEVFGAALEKPAEARDAFLRGTCGADEELRREVVSLIASQESAGVFLSGPALAPTPAPEMSQGVRRIGPYRVLGEAGHGGMGSVYRAIRDDDVFSKVVAVKLVGTGASPEYLRRLAREREILARLQHPGIAMILDGGTSSEGWPYFVMEYVDGEPIDAYCDRLRLGARERLSLFRAICDAVHYAHQNLVVHRDLKPHNILVSGDCRPKLLDFGIAKLLPGGADPVRAPTATLMPVMTPAYASPEQVSGQAVTTASDVYSLGVLLYELLAGRRPYEVSPDSMAQVIEVVCKVEPPPPSAVLARPAAGQPRWPVSRSQLEGDLDTIVLKALRKEPERRYLSALSLSEDIRRHIEGQPVLARGDTLAYRASKFVGRHRVAMAVAFLLVASLSGGLVTTAWQWRRAEANRVRAERRFADVRALSSSFLFDVHDAIADLPGSTAARQLVVDRSTLYLDSLAREARHDVGLQRELAAAYQRLGDAQGGAGAGNLGNTRAALASYDKAFTIRQALLRSPGEPDDVQSMAFLAMKQSRVLSVIGDWRRAEETARSAADAMEALAVATGADLRGRIGALYHQIGYIRARRGDRSGAVSALRKGLAASRAWSDAYPDDRDARANVARVETELAEQLGYGGEVRAAAELGRSAARILEELAALEPDNARYRRDLIFTLNVGTRAREATGDVAAANRDRRRAVALSEALVAAEPANQGDRIGLTYALQGLGAGLIRAGQVDDGLDHLVRAGRMAETTVAADPANAFARDRLAQVRAELAFALDQLRIRPGERCAALRESVKLWQELDAAGQLSGEVRPDLEKARVMSGACPPASP
jgi:tetratricopeptide (TPR) repeat protein